MTKRLEDSQLRAKMALRGSLLRPVLESIERRRDSELIDRTKVLVLTDGELLDAAPVCVPDEIELVGLAVAPPDSRKRAQWSRVLRNVTLTDLSDPAVDRLFDSEGNPFWGACEVSWEGPGSSLIAMDVNPQSFLGHQIDGSMKRWNSIDRPLLLLISTDSGNIPGPAVKCRSLRTGASIRVDLASANPVSDDVVRNVSSQLIEGTSEWGEVTLDVSASDPSFQQVEAQFQNARRLAIARAPWIDEEGTRIVWKDMALSDRASDEEGAAHFGALLCIAIQSLAAAKLIRILVFRLDMNRHPALTMGPDSSLHLHTKPFQINYDGLEARWMLSHSGMSIELDPRNSQELQIPVADGDDQMIITLFSGPMG